MREREEEKEREFSLIPLLGTFRSLYIYIYKRGFRLVWNCSRRKVPWDANARRNRYVALGNIKRDEEKKESKNEMVYEEGKLKGKEDGRRETRIALR